MSPGLLQRGATIPERVALLLREWVATGDFGGDGRLPSEPQLAAELGVSRASVRQAMVLLERDGLVVRRPGRGTFVSTRKTVGNRLNRNSGVTALIASAQLSPGTVALRVEERPATHEESDALEIEEGTEVIAIERLRTANEKPVVYTVDVIPSVSPELRTELHKLEGGGSLYDLLSDRTGLRVDHGVAALEPVAATAALATALNVPRRTPLLCLRQVDYAVGDQPALYSLEYHVAGAFRFTVYRDGPR